MIVTGGSVEKMGNKSIGVSDGRGHYLMLRCSSSKEESDWLSALIAQTNHSFSSSYVHPVQTSPAHPTKIVVIVDVGSSSIRAGVLGQQVSLPALFFPSVGVYSRTTKSFHIGAGAYSPATRRASRIRRIVPTSEKLTKKDLDLEMVPDLFRKLFTELNVSPRECWVMLSLPQGLSPATKVRLTQVLMGRFGVKGVAMAPQTMLSLYLYSTTSGVVVDIGERTEIHAISNGYLVDGSSSRHQYGGEKVSSALGQLTTPHGLTSEVEKLVLRYIKEKFSTIPISREIAQQNGKTSDNVTVDISSFNLPPGAELRSVSVESRGFSLPSEGLLSAPQWGEDGPSLPSLVSRAVAACPLDVRREMWKGVYVSGGPTLTRGFVERLQAELEKLAPPSVGVQVHASPHRYHAAFLGASVLALLPNFESQMGVSRSEWEEKGSRALAKWEALFKH